MASPFTILQQSPYDSQPCETKPPENASPVQRWVPSRYTVRATTQDDQLILWNTFTGSMSVFPPPQADRVREILRKPGIDSRGEGLIGYLVERGYLVNDGVNEFRQVQYAIGQQHYRTDALEFILLASEDCNFRCTYCYEKFARGTMEPWVRSAIKKMVEKRLPSLRELRATWFGGEPLYGFEAIKDLAPFFLETAQREGLHYASDMTTNAYLLTPEIAEQLLAWKVTAYQITIDGPPEYHDCSRPTRQGQGTFATIFENIRSLHQRKEIFQVALRVNFDRNNYPYLDSFFELLEKELRDDSRFLMRFRAVGRWGGERDAELEVCGNDEAPRIQKQLEEEARRRGLNVEGGLREVNRLGSQVCYAARPYNYLIGADGKIMKCTVLLDTKDYNVVGRIKEDGNIEINQDRMALWTEPAFENDSKCKKCIVLPLCQGTHCPLVRIEENQSPCTSVRLNAKSALLMTHELRKAPLRTVRVQNA